MQGQGANVAPGVPRDRTAVTVLTAGSLGLLRQHYCSSGNLTLITHWYAKVNSLTGLLKSNKMSTRNRPSQTLKSLSVIHLDLPAIPPPLIFCHLGYCSR